jgi:hypothetical protein
VPSYLIQYTTPSDVHAAHFTLDDDAPLEPQVRQVIEELRLQGHVLRGGPSDELAVFWQGQELDLRQSPRTLGVRASRPLELRMRPKPVASHQLIGDRYLSRVSYAAVLLGAMAASAVWALGLLVHDLPPVPASWQHLAADGWFAALLGVVIGGVVSGWEAQHTGTPVVASVSRGSLVGAVSALLAIAVGALLHMIVPPGLLALPVRLLTWAGLFGGLAGTLQWLHQPSEERAPGAAFLLGAGGGALGALLFNLPGAMTALWQGLALAMGGACVGYAVTGMRLRGARALVELEASNRRRVGLLRTRAFVLSSREQIPLRDVRAGDRTRPAYGASAWFDGEEVIVQPLEDPRFEAAPVSVSGTPLVAPLRLGDGETIDVGDTRYRLHVLRSGAW